MVEFRLLGPIVVGDSPGCAVGSGKQAALLAYLLLHRNRAVPRAALIDALWSEHPPATATHALNVHVSRLRKTLAAAGGEGLLTTHRGGFSLRLTEETLDLARFERLAEAARREDDPAARLSAAEQALALWRGPALADILDEPFARLESERLEAQRLLVAEQRLEALLALGRAEEVIVPLQALVSAHSLRELPRRLLMLALYRIGRQADALEVYRDLRQTLQDELGLEPSTELRELEAAILNHEAQLAPPPRREPPRQLEPRAAAVQPQRALFVLLLCLAAAGGIAALVLFATRGSSQLARIDFNGVGAINPLSGRILSEVVPSTRPGRLAVDGDVVWSANQSDDTVSRIDLSTASVVQTIPVGSSPSGIAVGGGAVWVADNLDGTVSRIDPRANKRVQTIRVGDGPTAVAFGLGSVWVSNAGDRTVAGLDPRTGKVRVRIQTGADGQGLAVGAGSLWVLDESSNRVVRIDARAHRVVAAVPVGMGPIAVTYAFGSVWTANSFDGTVSRVDPQTNVVTGTTDVGGSPLGIAAAGGLLWVADGSAARVLAIDPATNLVTRRVDVGSTPVAIAAGSAALWMSVQPAPGSHRGGTLQMVSPTGSLDAIDPAVAYFSNALLMTNDGLVAFRREGGSDGTQIVPDLAVSIPESQDGGTTWTFKLRSGIRYSTGKPVQPADFRYALERVFKLRSSGAGYYSGLIGGAVCAAKPNRCNLADGVVTDAATRTVTFHLTTPDPEFLDKLALPFTDAVPIQTASVHAGSLPLPATGPYKIIAYRQHRTLTLVRNPYFKLWSSAAQPDGFPDRIVWSADVPVGASTTAVEQGRADVMLQRPPADRLSEIETQYASQVHVHPSAFEHYVFMNTRAPPFNDLRVRQALSYALDRAEIVRLHGGPLSAEPTCQFIPPLLHGHLPYCPYTRSPTASGVWTAPDLIKAQRLVAASGTRGMRVVVWSPELQPYKNEMRYVTSVLRRLGYRTSITFSGDNYFGKIGDSRTHAQVGGTGWNTDYPNPSSIIDQQFRCNAFHPASPSNNNVAAFCDPRTDALIAKAEALAATNSQRSDRIWARIDRRIVDQAPYAPIYVQHAIDFVSRRVGDYQYSPVWGVLVDQLWIR